MIFSLTRSTAQRLSRQVLWPQLLVKSVGPPAALVAAETLGSSRRFSTVPRVEDPGFFRDPSLIKLQFKERLAKEREQAQVGGGLKRIERQHERGSLSARERLELLFDEGTFHEIDQLKAHRCTEFGMADKQFPGDGIVTGHGMVNGRHVYAFSQGMYCCRTLRFSQYLSNYELIENYCRLYCSWWKSQ